MTSGPGLTTNALRVLDSRYLGWDADGQLEAEVRFDGAEAPARYEEKFYALMMSLEFLPNSPTIVNVGTPAEQLAACFVLPVEDVPDGRGHPGGDRRRLGGDRPLQQTNRINMQTDGCVLIP